MELQSSSGEQQIMESGEQQTQQQEAIRCQWARRHPRLLLSLALCAMLLSIIAYLTLPQAIIQSRMNQATINLGACILVIGPHADAKITPTVGFSVSKDVLQLPLVSFTAHVKVTGADVSFQNGDKLETIGSFQLAQEVDIDSTKDINMNLSGIMTITEPHSLATLVNLFILKENITLGASARVNILAKVWGWFPVPFFGITVEKEITQPAFDDFKKNSIQLSDLISSQGKLGQLNVTASAKVFNPSPVTMIMNDPFQMQVLYPYNGKDYKLGTLYVIPPLKLVPGANIPIATLGINPSRDEAAIRDFIAKYIGPQDGFVPAGGKSKPLDVMIQDDGEQTSQSQLVREATRGLNVSMDFRPKTIFFLSAITGDISGSSSWPFYKITVHLAVKNPVPGITRVKRVDLRCYHMNRSGPLLYNYNHDIVEPTFNPVKYTMKPFQNLTVDFPLDPIEEVNFGVLWKPKEILQLMAEGLSKRITLGVSLNLTVLIDDSYEQVVPYENNALFGDLCFSLREPTTNCGGLPLNPNKHTVQHLERLEV